MKKLWLAPVVTAALLGCGDSTAPNPLTRPDAVLSNLGSMNVGDVRVITFAQAQNGLTIPSAEASAVYLIVAANVRGDTGTVPQYTVTGDLSGHGGPVLQGNRSLATPALHPAFTRVGGTRGAQFEAKVRGYERSKLGAELPFVRSLQPGTRMPRLLKDNVPVGTVPTVGAQYQFNVPGSGTDLCASSGYTTVNVTVKAVSNHAIVIVDNQTPNGGFSTASYDSIANEFDMFIYPTEVGYFGAPTDLDQNSRVFILFTPAVNRLTPPNTANTVGFVGGFTFAGDLFPNTPEPQGCPESNEGEIFYLMVPDSTPLGGNQFGNTFSTEFVRQQARVTMAHEFQHAIIAGHRIFSNSAQLESAWLDEALSSIGEDAVGRAEVGLGDLQLLTLTGAENMDPTMFNTFFATNFVRTQSYVLRPDTIGPVVTDNRIEQDVAAFGAGWAFLRYVADWYSGSDPRALTMALDIGPDSGTKNLTSHAGVPLDTLLAHWLVTMYTDGQGIPGLPAQYNYRTYNLRDIVTALCANPLQGGGCADQTYLPIDSIGLGTRSITLGIPSTSADYFLTSKFTGGARTIRLANPGSSGGIATTDYPYGRLYVVRIE